MKKYLFPLAVAGFILSFVIHFSGWFDINWLRQFPYLKLLHMGVFVVFVPLVFDARKKFALRETGEQPYWSRLKLFFNDPPDALLLAFLLLAGYAVFHFLWFGFLGGSLGGSPVIRDGGYFLVNHGSVLRELTEQEFRRADGIEARFFSGHWMIFYGTAALYFRPKNENVTG